ncbi:MAG: proton-conducting transporter membrane subunit [Gammaproteobacteria bacterium]
MLEGIVWLIPVLPLLAALSIAVGHLAGRNRGAAGERYTHRVALGALSLSLLLLLAVDLRALLEGELPGQLQLGAWLSSGQYRIELSFLLDALGLAMSHLVVLLTLLTLRFSVNYLHREAGYQRFFMIMSLFGGAMLLLVMAGNAVLTFVGWELAGLSSYLLIGYAFERPMATANATRAFITNRIGDAGFLLAVILSLLWVESVEWTQVLGCIRNIDMLSAQMIAGGFLLAALAKSAQLPFSPWIARALEGPTPSSALFYGAVMVHAGVFLVIRLQPLLEQMPQLMWLVALLGALTALYGFVAGLVQTDVKSALMFSTTAQVGLMFLACGLGWFELAAWHLALHAVWRAYHFLSAPGLMHLMSRRTRPVPRWLQRQRWLYTAAVQRFWIEHLSDSLLVKPTLALARDTQAFDQQVVNRMVGLPGSVGAVSSLAQWERQRHIHSMQLDGDSGDVGKGQGAAGKLMEWIATGMQWFEEHLVLLSGEQGLQRLILRIGEVLKRVDELLSRPRYLLLMLVITFVVIL